MVEQLSQSPNTLSGPAARLAVLSVDEMYRADALAIEAGVSGIELMEAAGRAVADAMLARWPGDEPVSVLCGPGNNGGDGFVAARCLMAAGREASLYLLGPFDALKGDAAHHAGLWREISGADPHPLSEVPADHNSIVIDALFGAGLVRPLDDDLTTLLRRIMDGATGTLAVDLPSGIAGDTGEVLGYAPTVDLTVTFFRKKPAHLLYPGQAHAGDVIVADIGTPENVLLQMSPTMVENDPALWKDSFPQLNSEAHKYHRGHLLVSGGRTLTGAARLAARAARRIGAGLATIITPSEAFDIYAQGDPGTMVETADTIEAFEQALTDPRRTAVVIGPGAGLGADVGTDTRERCLAALQSGKPVVLDADGISCFQGEPQALFDTIRDPACGPVILTPHEGEFARLFAIEGDKVSRARAAAKKSGAVILLKGPDTIIASPCGYVAINTNATGDLATAGSGDVLAGIVGALVAQGMPAFEATAAGAWIHGECGKRFGRGLIAEDICEMIPGVIAKI